MLVSQLFIIIIFFPNSVFLVEKFIEVTDSLCVAQRLPGGDERVVLFLKMADGYECDEKLVSRIRQTIRECLSARHLPYIILPIADIPVSELLFTFLGAPVQ